MTKTGAIQEVPYAAHGDGFSFVLGLLDRYNRMSEHAITDADSDSIKTDFITLKENSDMDVVLKDVVPSDTDTALLSYTIQPFRQLGVQRNHMSGSLLRMTTDEGVTMIQSCMEAAKKRTLSCLGSYRIKGVSSSGCSDLGLT